MRDPAEPQGDGTTVPRASATIICSDETRNGKTLFAKLACDLLRLKSGGAPVIFDTDAPDGDLLGHFGAGAGQVVNVARTLDHVSMIDGMLSGEPQHHVVDLSARHLQRFFDILRDVDFLEGAREAAMDVAVFFVMDRDASSVDAGLDLQRSLPKLNFIPVRNRAIGDPLDDAETARRYNYLRPRRDVVLPALSGEALGMIEHHDFHFDRFIAGGYDHFSFELKTELWGFLESLHEQRDTAQMGPVHPV